MRNLFKSHQNLIFDPSLLILLARLITLNFKKWFQRLEKLLARIRRNEKFPRNFNRGNLTRRLRRSVSLLRHILSVHRFVAAKQPLVPFATNPPTHLPRDLYKIIVRESVYLPLVVPTTYHVFNDTHTHTCSRTTTPPTTSTTTTTAAAINGISLQLSRKDFALVFDNSCYVPTTTTTSLQTLERKFPYSECGTVPPAIGLLPVHGDQTK